jgi:hypothetical protein
MSRCCVPARSDVLTPIFFPAARNIWQAPSLYAALRTEACEVYPNDFEAAFRHLCDLAHDVVRWPGFQRWASDYRRKAEAETLRVLAALDVDDFFRRHRPDDDGPDPDPPPPLALELETTFATVPERELEPA